MTFLEKHFHVKYDREIEIKWTILFNKNSTDYLLWKLKGKTVILLRGSYDCCKTCITPKDKPEAWIREILKSPKYKPTSSQLTKHLALFSCCTFLINAQDLLKSCSQ